MIVTKKFIQKMRQKYNLEINDKLEEYLLTEYEEEPFPYEWTAQDLAEQIKSHVKSYKNGELDVTIKPPTERLRERYEALKEEYMDLACEAHLLMKVVEEAGLTLPDELSDDEDDDLPF